MIVEPSPWDTEVFGYSVGKLNSGERQIFPYDISKLYRDKFHVVFAKSDGWVKTHGDVTAVDYLYDMEFKAWDRRHPFRISEVTATPEHLKLAGRAFSDSRFLRDPRLKELVPEMYARWIAGKKVWVLKGSENAAFLLPDTDPDGVRRVSLVAVDEDHRGSGIGRLLVSSVMQTELPATWRVKVSCQNYRAIRFYETVGFRIKCIQTAFHIWTF
jgi:ribosomal protein S18 acetylase RimI-like enzyme